MGFDNEKEERLRQCLSCANKWRPKLDLQVDNKTKYFQKAETLTSGRLRASRVFAAKDEVHSIGTAPLREVQEASTQGVGELLWADVR